MISEDGLRQREERSLGVSAGRLGASFTARLKGPQLPELLDVMQTPRLIKHGFPEMEDETI